MDELLHVNVISLPTLIWVQLHGELDLASAPSLLDAAAASPSEEFLVLDARGLAFCDVVGLRALSSALEAWAGRGHATACLLSAEVERVARLLHARDLLARVANARLLPHLASATVSDLDPPLAEWG